MAQIPRAVQSVRSDLSHNLQQLTKRNCTKIITHVITTQIYKLNFIIIRLITLSYTCYKTEPSPNVNILQDQGIVHQRPSLQKYSNI
jgi:hypothetical protein